MSGEPMTADGAQQAGEAGPGSPARPAPARWPLLFGVALFVVALDQLTKWWAVETLDTRTIDVAWTLRLRLTLNHGSAFSLANGRGPLISVLAIVIVVVLLRSGRHATRPGTAIAIGMVLGGAIGNLLDRGFREGTGFLGGGVVDFLDLQWWPMFTVGDSALVLVGGAVCAVSWAAA